MDICATDKELIRQALNLTRCKERKKAIRYVKNHGKPYKQIVEKYKQPPPLVEYNGKKYDSMPQLCRDYGLDYRRVSSYAYGRDIEFLEAFKRYLELKN